MLGSESLVHNILFIKNCKYNRLQDMYFVEDINTTNNLNYKIQCGNFGYTCMRNRRIITIEEAVQLVPYYFSGVRNLIKILGLKII